LETALEPIDIDEFGRRLRTERHRRGLSLRAVADEAGVPFNTLSRVERGHLPDLANYHRLTIWLGTDPGAFFTDQARRREPDTAESIRSHLHSDPHLTDDAAEQIAALVIKLYETLATPDKGIEVHLRAHSTFGPEAAGQLGAILEQLQNRILADPDIGNEPGWVG
jgi:transcriptional regulator with XRE-family HTH domain